MANIHPRNKNVANTEKLYEFLMIDVHEIIPHICHRHHRRCLCKKKLPSVNFHRFNAKNWQFTVQIGNLLCKFRYKFDFPKILHV